MKPFRLADFSTYRSETMGLAILYIMMFHLSLEAESPWFGIKRLGNIGVDIFLLVSGIGLWYSWQKDSSTLSFWKKRYMRVYPSYIIIAAIYFISTYQGSMDIFGGRNNCLFDLFMNIAFHWNFWLYDVESFWFVPCIMMLYTFTPFYLKAINRWPSYRWLPVLMIGWCIMVNWVVPIYRPLHHLEMFWSRMPIFFIGINLAVYIKEKREIEPQAFWLILISLLMFGGAIYYLEEYQRFRYPLYIERMLYIPMVFCIMFFQNKILAHTKSWIRRILSFLGDISLELYLVHMILILYKFNADFKFHFWINFLILFAISVPLAWILRRTTAFLVKRLSH